MSKTLPFITKDQRSKEQLKKDVCGLIDAGDYIILVSHRDKDNVTDLATNLDFHVDRIGLKGILREANEILFRVSPPICYPDDVEI